METIDEIVVRGQRWRRSDPGGAPPRRPSPPTRPGGGGGPPPGKGFVPPVVPQIIEEIIVKGKVPPRPPVQILTTGASAAGRFNVATIGASISGWVIRNIVRKLGEQVLEEAWDEWASINPEPKPDTEVRTLPTYPASEVVVTATRLQQAQALQVAPMPVFFDPDADPFVMIPVDPVRIPLENPITAPAKIVTAPLEIPVPARVPQRIATPTRLPFDLPLTVPQRTAVPLPSRQPQRVVAPLGQPAALPFAQPFAQPAAEPKARPQRAASTIGLAEPLALQSPFAQPFAMPQPQSIKNCPPCPKVDEEEEPRNQCFKKLVKEGILPSLDTSYDWAEIDCVTGREL